MWLIVQALPLIVLVAVLAAGRAGPLTACSLALLAALPAILGALGADTLIHFLLRQSVEAVWLALGPVGIIAGGLVFHAATQREAAPADVDRIELMFTAGFLFGPFSESVTGFGVGAVFAIGALRQGGLDGAPAIAVAQLSQMLIPWGGLGPGTALGAALAGQPAQAIAMRNAIQAAAWMLALLPLFWRYAQVAGHPVPGRQRRTQAAWVAAMAVLLVVANWLLPWEIAGVLATGSVLACKLWRVQPASESGARIAAIEAALPYVLLTLVLLGSRLWPHAPAWQPLPDLPALPVNHPMVAMWLVGLGVLAARTRNPLARAAATLRRAQRPALTVLLYVILARWLVGAGVPAALAGALNRALGALAPYASPLLAGLSGFFVGTNVGSNSAMMPLQAALGRLYELPPTLLPAVQNFVGSACMTLSASAVAVTCGLAGGAVRPPEVWRLAWPVFAIALAIGVASVAIG
jgi:lactate permease